MKIINLDFWGENSYFPCWQFYNGKSLFKNICLHKIFICEPIFKIFVALFKTFGMQNSDMLIFLEVFQKSEILENAVSGRWYILASYYIAVLGK